LKLFNEKTDQAQPQRRQGLRRFRAWPFFPHGLMAALALAMAPFVLTWFVLPELGRLAPFAPAMLAIVAASWFFGWKCSLLVMLSTLAGNYLMTPAQEEFKLHGARFTFTCLTLVLVLEMLARDRLAKEKALGELRRSDKRKSKFLSVLSHELRNPLAALSSGVDLLKRQARGATEQATVQTFERQIHHMKRLVDDLLEVARIDQGKIELQWAEVPLYSLTSDAVAMSMALTDAKKQSVQVVLPAQPLTVRVDATRITQVLCNLIHNASKFSPEGSQIELTVRPDAQALVFVVKDHGYGIPADQLEQIFTTYVQLDDPGKAQTGLGLGLSLVRRLIELHGGVVHARSNGRGHGSEFEVRLPSSCMVTAPAAPAGLAGDGAGAGPALQVLSILVVDDHLEVANAVAALLKMDGHRVVTAGNGADALKAAARHAPDLVILDVSLPDMNGHAVAQELRQSATDRVPLIIAMTGWATEHAREEADPAFEAYLLKPVSYEVLNRTISELTLTESALAGKTDSLARVPI
jgi:signal transduction histidine kinase/ActR/RegA family two-component response regulator